MFKLLKNASFTLLWVGQFISLLGDMILDTALPFYIYSVTGSALATGTMLVVEIVPRALLSPAAGVFVDRWDRRRTMIAMDLLRALVLVCLLMFSWKGSLWIAYVFVFLHTCMCVFFNPAKNAIIPVIVGEQGDLMKANSLISLSGGLAILIGPALGGAMLAGLGLASVVIIDILTYLVSAALIYFVQKVPGKACVDEECAGTAGGQMAKAAARVWKEFREGLRILWGQRILRAIFLINSTVTISHGILSIMFIVFIKDTLHCGPAEFGMTGTAQGIGGLLGSYLVGRAEKSIKPAYFIMAGPFAMGGGVLLMSLFPGLANLLVILGVLGIFFVGWSVSSSTLLQANTQDAFRGRVFGIMSSITSVTLIIGVILTGLLSKSLGAAAMFQIAAAVNVAAGVIAVVSLGKDAGTGVESLQPSSGVGVGTGL